MAPNGSLFDLGAHLGKAGSGACCDCEQGSGQAREPRMRSCLRECRITQRGLIVSLLILSRRANSPLTDIHCNVHQPAVPAARGPCVPAHATHYIFIKVTALAVLHLHSLCRCRCKTTSRAIVQLNRGAAFSMNSFVPHFKSNSPVAYSDLWSMHPSAASPWFIIARTLFPQKLLQSAHSFLLKRTLGRTFHVFGRRLNTKVAVRFAQTPR